MSQKQTNVNKSTKKELSQTIKGRKPYLEILGDTIKPNQLLLAIILSVSISLAGYNLGLFFLPNIAAENMVASYSLLIGISGSVLSVIICSIVFKPKRILIEEETSKENMREVFEDLQLDPLEELALIENDPITKKELEELGVLNSFRNLGGENKK